MYHPAGFSDSKNIIIKDLIPYYYYTGISYRDKLKNGLSLEYMFGLIIIEENQKELPKQEEERKNIYRYNGYEPSSIEDYDLPENFGDDYHVKIMSKCKINGFEKYKRRNLKKNKGRNLKKNKVKQDGYKYKLFTNEQNTPYTVNIIDDTDDLLYSNSSEDNYDLKDAFDGFDEFNYFEYYCSSYDFSRGDW
jgi:hypothetical protein